MSDFPPSEGLQLQRAVFLRGVSDPLENSRITTVFYRPKHLDLRYRDGFVQAGNVTVPVSNVVEMITLLGNPIVTARFEPAVLVIPNQNPAIGVADDAPIQVIGEHEVEEDKPVRRRGRPRKNPVG